MVSSIGQMPSGWRDLLREAVSDADLDSIETFVAKAREVGPVYPAPDDVFAALRLTSFDSVRAVILGQDPYHRPGQAHGLAFSVPAGRPIPPSLRNIRTELNRDLGLVLPDSGSLIPWAEHGILLLNTILTVQAGSPLSHAAAGWTAVTDAILGALSATGEPLVFMLWGRRAQTKASLIDLDEHVVLEASHPSPMSVAGFFGSRPFSAANTELAKRGRPPIDWTLSR